MAATYLLPILNTTVSQAPFVGLAAVEGRITAERETRIADNKLKIVRTCYVDFLKTPNEIYDNSKPLKDCSVPEIIANLCCRTISINAGEANYTQVPIFSSNEIAILEVLLNEHNYTLLSNFQFANIARRRRFAQLTSIVLSWFTNTVENIFTHVNGVLDMIAADAKGSIGPSMLVASIAALEIFKKNVTASDIDLKISLCELQKLQFSLLLTTLQADLKKKKEIIGHNGIEIKTLQSATSTNRRITKYEKKKREINDQQTKIKNLIDKFTVKNSKCLNTREYNLESVINLIILKIDKTHRTWESLKRELGVQDDAQVNYNLINRIITENNAQLLAHEKDERDGVRGAKARKDEILRKITALCTMIQSCFVTVLLESDRMLALEYANIENILEFYNVNKRNIETGKLLDKLMKELQNLKQTPTSNLGRMARGVGNGARGTASFLGTAVGLAASLPDAEDNLSDKRKEKYNREKVIDIAVLNAI
jgi:hypothetical protein